MTPEEGGIQVEQFTEWTEWSQVWSLAAVSENYSARAQHTKMQSSLNPQDSSVCDWFAWGEREHNLVSYNCNPELPLWQRPQ